MATPPVEQKSIETNTEILVGLYTMFFRHNSNSLQSKNFRFNGNLKQAEDRAQDHCKLMGYRFHWVQPLISDLKREEDFHFGRFPTPPAPLPVEDK